MNYILSVFVSCTEFLTTKKMLTCKKSRLLNAIIRKFIFSVEAFNLTRDIMSATNTLSKEIWNKLSFSFSSAYFSHLYQYGGQFPSFCFFVPVPCVLYAPHYGKLALTRYLFIVDVLSEWKSCPVQTNCITVRSQPIRYLI